ncbi:D-isomer specific 2-hydroxyacid dehydrogenase NAD-binding protein [Paracoccus aminophilus JCM 7686]|uniref:D-isomer specific 2-hydroxyacid dehydrogenase NAD-binding protein n=2 Tax=Paracoccus aminophilus TaxID=34003 RepID=S5YFU8_PARAH|nr:D-isomer specific 2-hydroxyacid dehydrogenase NAD-binding protein [Paracoccus aminophilus JCM 7686]
MRVLAIGTYSDLDAEALRQDFGAEILPGLDDLAGLSGREAVAALAYKSGAALDGAVMDRLPGLKVIANFGVGYDAIDIPAATARGIQVTNTPDVLNDDVADLAVAMWIALARQMYPAENWLREGAWHQGRPLALARKASGRRVGILGLGRIGREIANRLAAFKCEIHYVSRQEKETPGWTYHADATSLAAAVDDLFVALVGGPDTEGAVSAEVILALGADGTLINIARGSVVDEEALLQALGNRLIRGAALDVFRDEPNIDRRFLALDNVLLLPHIGSATTETRAEMGALQRQNLRAVLDGQPALTPVNRV